MKRYYRVEVLAGHCAHAHYESLYDTVYDLITDYLYDKPFELDDYDTIDCDFEVEE